MPNTAGPSEPISVGTARAMPGESVRGALRCGDNMDGTPLEIPVHVVRGRREGPVLWAQGACHGDEYDGTVAMLRLLRELEPDEMVGTLVAVPAVNMAAFLNNTRVSPYDGKDLNRFYPGDPEGSYTDRLAHLLRTEIPKVATHFVEHHGGGDTHDVMFYTLHCSHEGPVDQVRDMCDAMGAEVVWGSADAWLDRSLFHQLHRDGIPAVLIECGGEGRLHPRNVSDHFDALRNLMIHLGMLPGQVPSTSEKVKHRVLQADFLTCSRGGMVELHASTGDVLKRGDALASILDLDGNVAEAVRVPTDHAVVLAIRTYGTVPSGGSIALLGRL